MAPRFEYEWPSKEVKGPSWQTTSKSFISFNIQTVLISGSKGFNLKSQVRVNPETFIEFWSVPSVTSEGCLIYLKAKFTGTITNFSANMLTCMGWLNPCMSKEPIWFHRFFIQKYNNLYLHFTPNTLSTKVPKREGHFTLIRSLAQSSMVDWLMFNVQLAIFQLCSGREHVYIKSICRLKTGEG